MRKQIIAFFLLMLCPLIALADGLGITPPAQIVRPGKSCLITFEAAQTGSVSLVLLDEEDREISVVVRELQADKGMNQVWWNGTFQGVPAPDGTWRLVLEQNGDTAECPVTVGAIAPFLTDIQPSGDTLTPDAPLTITYQASSDGWLTLGVWLGDTWHQLETQQVQAGEGQVTWDGEGFSDGVCTLTLLLTNENGDASGEEHLPLKLEGFAVEAAEEASAPVQREEILTEDPLPLTDLEEAHDEEPAGELLPEEETAQDTTAEPIDQSEFTPAYTSPYKGTDDTFNYWTMPMDITDEEAVWAMLTAPITVVDTGSKSSEKTQAPLRAMPNEDAERVGVVTCETQGVHVLQTLDNGWSLVECYSSSFHDTKVKAWNTLVQGYIKTSYLKQVTPNQKMGFVIDKLTQRLYIFREGKLYTTLLVSTGLANARQPYNETRSGEFITASKVGEFRSDNLYCSMAIRFNSGDLLHEVPHTLNGDGSSNYRNGESKLGTKASHGCIRVQRRKTPEGVNMSWIWNNMKGSSKVRLVIWEDWQGRQMTIPADDFQLYYNAKGGQYYHSAATCYSASGKTFEPFAYAQLDEGSFAKLERCPYCAPVLRKGEIEEINQQYLPGGNHDPIMTEARKAYFEMLTTLNTDLLLPDAY